MGVRQASSIRLTASSVRHNTMVGEPIAGEVCAEGATNHGKRRPASQNADRELGRKAKNGSKWSDAGTKWAG